MVLASAVLTHPHGADLRSAPEPSLFAAVALSSPFRLGSLRFSVCESPKLRSLHGPPLDTPSAERYCVAILLEFGSFRAVVSLSVKWRGTREQ